MTRLGVNIDHVATLRQAQRRPGARPRLGSVLAELGGADGITVHLREDRRHIQDRDLRLLRQTVQVRLNLELAADPSIITLATELRPDQVTLVPERREELTTEGGLDLVNQHRSIGEAVDRCRQAGRKLPFSLIPNPPKSRPPSFWALTRSSCIRGDTLTVGRACPPRGAEALRSAAETIVAAGVELHAGHGLNYRNVSPVARLDRMAELNIGHSIVSRAICVGMERAVREMKICIDHQDTQV